MIGGSGAYASSPEKILKTWCSLLCYGGIPMAPSEILENILQLKSFGLYFEGIRNRKWLLSYRNDISYRDATGFGGMLPKKLIY